MARPGVRCFVIDVFARMIVGSVDWFNNRRLLEPIGDIPPVELEQAYYRRHESHALGV